MKVNAFPNYISPERPLATIGGAEEGYSKGIINTMVLLGLPHFELFLTENPVRGAHYDGNLCSSRSSVFTPVKRDSAIV